MDAFSLRVPLGDNLINFIFLGSLLLLVAARFVLIPKDESIFKFKSLVIENENFTLYVTLCSLIHIVLLTLALFPFFNLVIPFYNSEILKLLILFIIIFIYQVVSYTLGNGFFLILGKNKEYQENYKNRYIFLFIKLLIAIFLCFIVYYTSIPKVYIPYIAIGIISVSLIAEWIWLMFFIKKQINLPGYYEFLYLCTFEILPALCILKLVFLGDKP
ncbi:DUF4271 domain-containing protein [Apibacter sp. HY039]|uniref:DUF4271 domain-containing protein n=1 Tax=Apibacter sp. HY039 TaxID=2501476 RepID=UPI0013E35911|nr:DUF4271 domain-containing protein [Apibacter sp. HY039]